MVKMAILLKEGWVVNTVERATELAYNRDMSLNQLSMCSGVSYSTFMRARSRGTQLSVESIEKICIALSISLSDFFTETKENN